MEVYDVIHYKIFLRSPATWQINSQEEPPGGRGYDEVEAGVWGNRTGHQSFSVTDREMNDQISMFLRKFADAETEHEPPSNYSSLPVLLFFVLFSILPPITSIFDVSSDEIRLGFGVEGS